MNQPMDISQLSVQQLLALREDIDSQMVTRQQAELDKLRADVLEMCSSRGYTLQQVMAPLRKKATKKSNSSGTHFVKGKTYQNPADPTQTWQGFGQRPTWVKEHLDKGGAIAQLEQQAPAATTAEPATTADSAATTPPAASTKADQKPAAKKSVAKKPSAKPATKKPAAATKPKAAA